MTPPPQPDLAPTRPLAGSLRAEDGPALAAWHAAWAVAAALLALGGRWLGAVDGAIFYGIVAMVVPGLIGVGLLIRNGQAERLLLLAAWGLAAVMAAAFSGGLSGPLAGFVFLPLAAGLAMGGSRAVQIGAVGVALAVLSGLFSTLLVDVGPHRPVLATIAALLTAGAAIPAVGLSWRQGERRLGRAEAEAQRLERLLAAQGGLTLVVSPDGQVRAAYGRPPAGVSVAPLFAEGLIATAHAPDRPALLAAMSKALSGQDVTTVRIAPRGALDRRLQLHLSRMDEADGPRLIVQAFDATPQYAHELGLEAARFEAETREAGKTRFLANMSHELRTPLNAVLGFADMMRQRLFGALPERYGEYADNIHEAGGHLLDLINDVLDVSKIEAERYTLSLERFDAREVISAAVALVRVTADERGVNLSAILPSEPIEVSADKRALKQITLNLLSNAVKFTPAGGAVTITSEAVGSWLELAVADTGVGIAPEDVKRLGRPFEQAGAIEQRRQGTGLGLSLVRALAELHGGQMSIDSTLGEGTAVTVRMPVAVPARAPVPEGGAEIIPMPLIGGVGTRD